MIIPFRNHRTKVVEAGSKNLDIAVLKKDHPLTFLADSEVDKIVAGRDYLLFFFWVTSLTLFFIKKLKLRRRNRRKRRLEGSKQREGNNLVFTLFLIYKYTFLKDVSLPCHTA